MALVEYAVDESVAVVTMNSGENRFNPDFLNAFLEVLDQVEQDTDTTTMVVKSAHEKIFTNGIDLEWLAPIFQQNDMDTTRNFLYTLNRLYQRVLTYPLITVAAITGHVFAGGAILACAFDFRFMRSDRGFFCVPEIDLGIPFLPGMLALLQKAIPMYKFEELHYTGRRLTAEECEAHHIISKACHIDDLMNETLAFAKSLNKRRPVIKEMKQRLYRDIVRIMEEEDVPYLESSRLYIG